MNNNISLVGVIVNIDGKELIYRKGDFEMVGGGFEGEDYGVSDNGITLRLNNKGRLEKEVEIGNVY